MLVTHDGERFIAHTEYSDREKVKAAGFLWHPQARKWWTKFPARAALLRAYCDENALLALAAHFAKLEASRATDSAIDVPCPDGLSYLPYQKAGIAYATGRSSTLIADEMGLGKTVQALGVINATETIRRVLVICPTSLRLNWQREAQKWLVRKAHVEVISDNTWGAWSIIPDAATITPGVHVTITNYERMVKLENELAKVTWDLIILDEAHYCKNPKAARSQAAYRLAGAAKQKLLLTGTPILNKPVEVQPLAGLCDPDRFGDPRIKRTPQCWSFLKRYCGAHQEERGRRLVWVFDGATNLDELQERLRASCMVRRLKADVLGELPPKRRQVIPIEATEPTTPAGRIWWEALQAAEAEAALAIVEKDKAAYAEAAKKLKYLQQVAFEEMSEYRHRLGMAKVARGVEYVRELLEGGVEKVIVFGHHRDVLQTAYEALSADGTSPVMVWGGMKDEDRQAAVDRFQNDPTCRIFLGQIQAAGVGLTLTAACHVVFIELDWVPANTSQAEDRAHRIGQRDVVFVHHLVVDGGLDAHMVKKMVRKQEIAENALDRLPEYEDVDPGELAKMPEQKNNTVRKVPIERRQTLLGCLRFLAARCDGAQLEDGTGFNKLDSGFGKKLAALDDLSDAQFYAGFRLARKYRDTQLKKFTTTSNFVAVLGLDKESPAVVDSP